jgi:16S rRNA (cytidine1402-2'-O)-methyltransferase
LAELLPWVRGDDNQQRGEIVLAVSGATAGPSELVNAERLLQRLALELPPRRAAAIVADLTGGKARDLYRRLLEEPAQ